MRLTRQWLIRSVSEQYQWLEKQLAALETEKEEGKVVWTFVSFHHPAYSSDETIPPMKMTTGTSGKGKAVGGI